MKKIQPKLSPLQIAKPAAKADEKLVESSLEEQVLETREKKRQISFQQTEHIVPSAKIAEESKESVEQDLGISIKKAVKLSEAKGEQEKIKENGKDRGADCNESALSDTKPNQSEVQIKKSLLNLVQQNSSLATRTHKFSSSSLHLKALALPKDLELLFQIFVAMDSVLSCALARDECCLFVKQKKQIENMVERTISLARIAQLKQVSPEAFHFQAVNTKTFGRNIRTFSFEHPAKSANVEDSIQMKHDLAKRKEKFRQCLVQLVHSKHDAFLERMGIGSIGLEKLVSWHAKFDLEAECSGVLEAFGDEEQAHEFIVANAEKSAEILKSAEEKRTNEKNATESNAINKNDGTNQQNKGTNQQNNGTNQLNSSSTQQDSPSTQLNNSASQLNNTYAQLNSPNTQQNNESTPPLSLLERVRLKERLNTTNMLTKEHQANSLTQISLAPLVDSLYVLFSASKKSILPQETIIHKLIAGSRSALSPQEAWTKISTLVSLLPEWLAIVETSSSSSSSSNICFLKVVQKFSLSHLKSRLLQVK